jgi:uncharacterized protein YjbI with pentapeptide repeats
MVRQQVGAMANPEHLAKLKEGVKAWNEFLLDRTAEFFKTLELSYRGPRMGLSADLSNADLRGTNLRLAVLVLVDLSAANLEGADIIGGNLRGANLSGADLNGANLAEADLSGANLTSANLSGADLKEADLSGETDLSHADLRGAQLTDANFTGAELGGANFKEASMRGTIFGSNDLSAARGLEAVRHSGHSIIGIETILQSKGQIPESFLRGCGVPEEFIIFAKSLATNPIQFYSCFISYSTKDQAFADRLHADLQNKGVRCWFAPHDVQGGKKLHEQIDEAIRLHDKLLLILSPHSMESEWVKTEIAKARKREMRDPEGVLKRRVLFPIRLAPFETLRDWECFDADTGKDSAREIREYFIPDFSNWKNHDSYQEAFQRLISDLKASSPARV